MTNASRPAATLSTASTTSTMIFLVASLVLVFSYDVYAENPSEVVPMGTPDLETFSTYEDMRRYFANRNLRSLRYLENPEDDSYIDAFNKHNEQPAQLDLEKLKVLGSRTKRTTEQKTLPTEPKILKFEISDAVEPNDELKAIIRQHRSREITERPTKTSLVADQSMAPTVSQLSTKKPQTRKITKSSRKPSPKPTKEQRAARSKRAAVQQTANFKVRMIPFGIEDAKDPDEVTKKLIKQMRALDSEHSKNIELQSVALNRDSVNPIRSFPPKAKLNRHPKLKRSRRSATKTEPAMFKFELEDAKEPDSSMKKLLQEQHSRESKSFKESKPTNASATAKNATQTSDFKKTIENLEGDNESGDDDDDQNGHESRRFYIYKEAPKVRKSINSLPHQVQKAITHLLKEHENGKAYIKYIPSEQMDYGQLKVFHQVPKIQQPLYGTKLKTVNTYAKFQPLMQKSELLKVQAVPVVEKVRYVYTPVSANSEQYPPNLGHTNHLIQQPIVVKDTIAPPAEIYHSYAADLSRINNPSNDEVFETTAHAIKDVPAPQFKPSKPDPVLEENQLPDNYVPETPLPIERLKYELLSYDATPQSYYHAYAKPHIQLLSQAHPELEKYKMPGAGPTAAPPVIKIEYHASTDAASDNYKNLEEFKELSTLMGKSPEDQIHGLTYLLAKEVQNKILHRSKQTDADKRPQDNTAPILFHPNQQVLVPREPKITTSSAGRLLGLGKLKEYVPIVEETAAAEPTKAASTHQLEAENLSTEKEQVEKEFLKYDGLSPNYEVIQAVKGKPKFVVERLVHHPFGSHSQNHIAKVGQHSTEVKLGAGLKLADESAHFGVNHDDHNEALQYASKYAFGYRIRDFHTGNDFGHKQNRDLDGVTRGQYHILLPDGRIQNVIYHADDTGFHADVSFESGH